MKVYAPPTLIHMIFATFLTADTSLCFKEFGLWVTHLPGLFYPWLPLVISLSSHLVSFYGRLWPRRACSERQFWSMRTCVRVGTFTHSAIIRPLAQLVYLSGSGQLGKIGPSIRLYYHRISNYNTVPLIELPHPSYPPLPVRSPIVLSLCWEAHRECLSIGVVDKIISRVLETVVGVRATVPEAAVRQARGQWQDDRCTWERCVRLRGQAGPGQANKVLQALRLCGLKGKGSRVDTEDFVLRKEEMMPVLGPQSRGPVATWRGMGQTEGLFLSPFHRRVLCF